MNPVYITLISRNLYAIVNLESDFAAKISPYVESVDWLSYKDSQKNQIIISAVISNRTKSKQLYNERINVFGQRMIQCGADVFIKNENSYACSCFNCVEMTEDQLFEIETFDTKKIDKISDAQENIAHYKKRLEIEQNERAIQYFKERILKSEYIIEKIEKDRQLSKNRISDFFKNFTYEEENQIEYYKSTPTYTKPQNFESYKKETKKEYFSSLKNGIPETVSFGQVRKIIPSEAQIRVYKDNKLLETNKNQVFKSDFDNCVVSKLTVETVSFVLYFKITLK